MKVEELRIGNYVNFKFKTGDIITIKKDYCEIQSDNMIIKSEYSDLQPIPLTPDILEKCGFDMNPDWEKYDGYAAVLDLGWLNIGMSIMGGVCLFDNDNRSTGTNIKYLHQLQNLYYALTGEELNFKP
jgi:hypothetical protein